MDYKHCVLVENRLDEDLATLKQIKKDVFHIVQNHTKHNKIKLSNNYDTFQQNLYAKYPVSSV